MLTTEPEGMCPTSDNVSSQCEPETCAVFRCMRCFAAYLAASNPQTPVRRLRELAAHSNPRVRRCVADNEGAPPELLQLLAQDECLEVRLSVGSNCTLTEQLLFQLVNDDCADVRYALAENPRLPESVLALLARDGNPFVADRAVRSLKAAAAERKAKDGNSIALTESVDRSQYSRIAASLGAAGLYATECLACFCVGRMKPAENE